MSVNFKVKPENKSAISRKILRTVAKSINNKLPKVQQNIERHLKEDMKAELRAAPEYQALISGPLSAHFGLPAGTESARVDRIIDTIVAHAQVSVTKMSVVGNGLKGGIDIVLPDTVFNDIFSLPEADVEGLPWLKWLLVEGNNVIVSGHRILFKLTPFSRSGHAIMVGSKSGVWRVPPQYAGTLNDNWITRALQMFGEKINQTIVELIRKEFS